MWDSGRVESGEIVAIRYTGHGLNSGSRYFGRVMLWDKAGKPNLWSDPAWFLTGNFSESDGRGKWISANVEKQPKERTFSIAIEAKQVDEMHWVQADLGEARPIDRVELHPM